jgi:hypothetical protein
MSVVGWTVAVAAPLRLAWPLRGRAAWINALRAVGRVAYLLILSARNSHSYQGYLYLLPTLALYALCAVGSVGLLACGLWPAWRSANDRLSKGLLLGALQLVLVRSRGGKLLFDRMTRPRVWGLAQAYVSKALPTSER